MRFAKTIRLLRKAKGFTLRAVGRKIGVCYASVSKVENGKLDFVDCSSEGLIRRLAPALDADEEGLLLLAGKIPEAIRRRVCARPDALRRIARIDDRRLDQLLASINER
jgi:HTH-type transcriptional regulator, competence development regulator